MPLAVTPAIHLRHGRVVLLAAGDPLRVAAERPSPETQARAFEEAGARTLQVIDLDAALGEKNQWGHLGRLLSDRRSRILFGGGVRSMTQVQQLLDLGVQEVLVGTQGVRNPLWLRELARIFPGRVIAALDARGTEVLVAAWTEPTGLDVVDVAASLDDAGLAGILYNDVADGAAHTLDRDLVTRLLAVTRRTPLWVGAARATIADLDWLAQAGVAGVVVGRSVYEGTLDLAEAVRRHPGPPPPKARRFPAAAQPAADDPAMDQGEGETDGEEE